MQNIPDIWRDENLFIPLLMKLQINQNKVMRRRTFFGIIFVVVGLLKLADVWGIAHLDWLWQQPWTVYFGIGLIIYIGIELIISSYENHPDQWLKRPLPIGEDGKRIVCTARYGGDEYVFKGEPFHGARLDTFCGGIRMDLRDAAITEDEEIEIHTFCGGVELIVPQTVNVLVKSRNFIGGVGNHAAQTIGKDVHCLHIIAYNFLGGVDIKN